MPRIRTVKPSFFRHEGLQDLEAQHPGQYVMLVFAGLWTQADKEGRFEYRPRQLHLDILPFLPFDFKETLNLLRDAGFICHYEAKGKAYGVIPSFSEHQRISGKEAQAEPLYPAPPKFSEEISTDETEKQQGSAGEASEKHPGSQGNGNGRGIGMEIEKVSVDTFSSVNDEPSPLPSVPPNGNCPHQAIIDIYHRTLPQAPQVRVWPPEMQNILRTRWKEDRARQCLDWWRQYFEFVRESDFLCGRTDNPFMADLEWLVRPRNFTKVVNGRYHSRGSPDPKNKHSGIAEWLQMKREGKALQ